MILRRSIPRFKTHAKREIYKGRVIQGCARPVQTGYWQAIISIQLGGGLTDIIQIPVEQTFATALEAERFSVVRAKHLIDTGGLDQHLPAVKSRRGLSSAL